MIGMLVLAAACAVEFAECERCDKRMRFSEDGASVTVNVARLRDDAPSAAELAARKAALARRAEQLAVLAADTRAGGRKRPLMGWSSWNTFALRITDRLVVETAEAMATNGLAAAGYRYVNIDDGFFDGRDEAGNLKIRKDRFPNGLKPVADAIHALGLKAGIYSEAGADTCGSMWGDKDLGGRGGGLYGHDAADCRFQFVENGFDFIKIDFCGGNKLKLDVRERYTEISRAIKATGRDVRFNICRWAFPGTWAADVAESWRTTRDIRANWSCLKRLVEENLHLGVYIKPGHYNDMDMLEVGHPFGATKTGFGKSDTGLTPDEETAHFGLWCFFSSPLLIGCDVRTIPAFTLSLITNPFLLAMNQNDLAAPPRVVRRDGDAYVLAKDADEHFGTARYVALFNASDAERALTVDFASLELGGRVAALDLVERADIGEAEGAFTVTLPPHAAKFYRLDAERRLQRTLFEAEDAFLADYTEIFSKNGDYTNGKRVAGVPAYVRREGASGGTVVEGLGGKPSNDLVWRDVRVTLGGADRLQVVADGTGYSISVDGGEPVPADAEIRLAPGVHAVRLFHPTAAMPAVDCLRLVR